LDVLGLDSDTLGVDGSQVGVFKQTNQVSFRGFLQSTNGRGLETQVGLEVLGNFTDQSLERQLSDQELGGLLVSSDFSESNSTRSVSVGLLDTTSGRGRFTGSFGSQLLSWGFATSGFTGSLFSSGHFGEFCIHTVL
jgi:histone H3